MRFAEPFVEPFNVLKCVVKVETGARRGDDIQFLHQRLRAVMSRADCNTVHIQNPGDVVRVNVLYVKGEDPGFLMRLGAVENNAINLLQTLVRIFQEFLCVNVDCLQSRLRDEIHCISKSDGFGDARRACFKLRGDIGISGHVAFHRANHGTATEERRHLFQQRQFSV